MARPGRIVNSRPQFSERGRSGGGNGNGGCGGYLGVQIDTRAGGTYEPIVIEDFRIRLDGLDSQIVLVVFVVVAVKMNMPETMRMTMRRIIAVHVMQRRLQEPQQDTRYHRQM